MSNISAYLEKAYLDWVFGGATPTQPSNRWAGLAIGTPTSVSGSEMGTLTGYARQTALFGAAASPAGNASNTNGMTFGPFSSAGSVIGVHLWDGSPVGSSNMLFYGTLLTARTVGINDALVFLPGALSITLA